MLQRYLEPYIIEDLQQKMAFLSGPRQVGKTTLAQKIGKEHFQNSYAYLNWDERQDRKLLIQGSFPGGKDLIILDEIHKFHRWKNFLKGQYDKHKDDFKILVTGSARLDVYRKGGDSLLGRYHPYRLHPLSMAELENRSFHSKLFERLVFPEQDSARQSLFSRLYTFGGFPHVYLKGSAKELRRWHNERVDQLVKEDIRDLENLRDLSLLQVLIEMLPSKVGSLLSLNALREDLEISHKTIASWVDILERFYYHFRIYPFQSRRIRSLRKEPKLYLWDWSELENETAKLENFVASHLLKFTHFLNDVEGYRAQLYFIRDHAQKEVDFLVTIDQKSWFAVEVKTSSHEISKALKSFKEKLNIPFAYQILLEDGVDFLKEGVHLISLSRFLSALV